MNKKIAMFFLCTLIPIFVIPSVIFAVSFDCGKAKTEVEKLICGDDELSKLDESLNEVYLRALNRADIKKQAIESQRQWLKYERDVCQDAECIKKAYETRIWELGLTSSFGIVIFRDPSRITSSPKAPVKIPESEVEQPSEKMTQTQTEQQSDISAQDDILFIKGCPEPILSDNPFKSKETNALYIQAFQRGYEMGLREGYKSKLDPDQILKNPLIHRSSHQQRLAWYYGWHAGRWYGVAKATGHGCTKRMSPWTIAPLKIRYAFFREAMKSDILDTYKLEHVLMLMKESKPYCEKLLRDILNDENIEVVEPLLAFENTDHPALANYRSCDSRSALHVYDDRGIPRSITFSDIGTQAFRFYGDLRLSKDTIAKDVIYSESESYFAGYYSTLNPQSCEVSILATNASTSFDRKQKPSESCYNFLIRWRGKYIDLEGCGDPPYEVRADSLEIRQGSFHIIDCDWVGHATETAAVNPWGGKPVLRSIIKDKTEKPGSDKGSKTRNQN